MCYFTSKTRFTLCIIRPKLRIIKYDSIYKYYDPGIEKMGYALDYVSSR